MEVKAKIEIVDTDTEYRFGYGTGNCISPPEEVYLTAEVKVAINVGDLGIDGILPLSDFEVTGWSWLGGEIILDIRLVSEMISRSAGIYER